MTVDQSVDNDPEVVEGMLHYESARNRWVYQYGTMDGFEAWYASQFR